MENGWALVSAVQSLTAVACIGIIGWTIVAITRARHGKAAATQLPFPSLTSLEARMERLEQTTEAIALQVERIAEGQRFVTKLLSDGEHQFPRLGGPR